MTGSVELAPDHQHLLVRFPYREDLVAAVKGLPGRRWDPAQKLWRVPATAVEQVFALLSRHLFEFAPEVSALLAGTLQAAPLPAVTPSSQLPPTDATPPDALTIGQLNARVRDGLRQQFPQALWVVGEIVDFDKGKDRQHRFFQLIEKARHETRPTAAVEVALFASAAERLLPGLANQEPPLVLRDGLEVRLLVRLDLYQQSGRFQIVVQDIDPSFTLGKLALSREQILRELDKAGLLARNRQLGFPVPTTRIGVLTSPDGDGWNDLLRHLQEAGMGFQITLYPIKVQGPELKPSLLAGLRWFAAQASEFDAICIVRGGGARSDLAWFDDREIAFAVARHPAKIVVGIGHQRDQSVLDAIAHSEKTPTAVAELLVRGLQLTRAAIPQQASRLRDATLATLAAARQQLLHQGRRLQLGVADGLGSARGLLAEGRHRLATAAERSLLRRQHQLQLARAATATSSARTLERTAARLDQQATRLRLLDPQRVLQRGFVIVRAADGTVLPSAGGLMPDVGIELQFRDGRVGAKITTGPMPPT
jgi:exodeoxyribonuclease VII large subunit